MLTFSSNLLQPTFFESDNKVKDTQHQVWDKLVLKVSLHFELPKNMFEDTVMLFQRGSWWNFKYNFEKSQQHPVFPGGLPSKY